MRGRCLPSPPGERAAMTGGVAALTMQTMALPPHPWPPPTPSPCGEGSLCLAGVGLFVGLAPFGPERARPGGVAFVEEVRGDDTVHAEMAEIAAQLAPGGHHADGLVIADGDGPDFAFGDPAQF